MTAQNESVLSRALNETGLSPVGRAIKHDHAYVSRFRTNEQGIKWDDLLALLEACGLKLVPAGEDMKLVSQEDWNMLLRLANKGMRALNNEIEKG